MVKEEKWFVGIAIQLSTWLLEVLFNVPLIQYCLPASIPLSVDFGNIKKFLEWCNDRLFDSFVRTNGKRILSYLLSSKVKMDVEIVLWIISYSRQGQGVLVQSDVDIVLTIYIVRAPPLSPLWCLDQFPSVCAGCWHECCYWLYDGWLYIVCTFS